MMRSSFLSSDLYKFIQMDDMEQRVNELEKRTKKSSCHPNKYIQDEIPVIERNSIALWQQPTSGMTWIIANFSGKVFIVEVGEYGST